MQQKKAKQYIIIKLFVPVLRLVAAVTLFIGLGIRTDLIRQASNKTHFDKTYNELNSALWDSIFVLDKPSEVLQKGEETSVESMKTIEKFNIDGNTLNSIQGKHNKTPTPIIKQSKNNGF